MDGCTVVMARGWREGGVGVVFMGLCLWIGLDWIGLVWFGIKWKLSVGVGGD